MQKLKSKNHIRQYAFCIALLSLLFLNACEQEKEREKISVLTYHRVVSAEIKRKYYPNYRWVNDLEVFKKQMAYLHENNYKTLSMDEFYDWYVGKVDYDNTKTVLLTFDDGDIENYYNVLPILKKYNFKATVFIIGNKTKDKTTWDEQSGEAQFLSKELLEKMRIEYPDFEIQNHTYGLHEVDKNKKKRVHNVSKKQIKDDFDKMDEYNFRYIAYPFGQLNKNIVEVAKEKGYKLGLGFRKYKRASRADNAFEIHRLNIDGKVTEEEFKMLL